MGLNKQIVTRDDTRAQPKFQLIIVRRGAISGPLPLVLKAPGGPCQVTGREDAGRIRPVPGRNLFARS